MRRFAFALVALSVPLGACGGDDSAPAQPDDSGVVDASTVDARDSAPPTDAGVDAHDATVDAGPDVTFPPPLKPYERFPQVDYLGGALLTSMKIVTVTFASDDSSLVSSFQNFDDTITTTSWWTDSTSEYCVMPKGTPCIGPGNPGGHVVLSETPPSNLNDTTDGSASDVSNFIQDRVTSGVLPNPDDQTIYVLWFPSGTTIHLGGATSCSSFGAYHQSTQINPKGGGAAVEAAYAVEPRCGGLDYLTFAASHELIEAATDAHPEKKNGYVMQDFGLWFYGQEVGDICDYPDFLTTTAGGYNVQRGWSNKSGRAGHDPCVPQPMSEVYFNVAPEAGKQIVYLADGESTTFNVEAYADGTTEDWSLSAEDISNHLGENQTLSFSFDKPTINAGQTAKLTITMNGKPSQNVAAYMIHSTSTLDSNKRHVWGATVQLK